MKKKDLCKRFLYLFLICLLVAVLVIFISLITDLRIITFPISGGVVLIIGLLFSFWPITSASKAKKMMRGRCQTSRKVWLYPGKLEKLRRRNSLFRKQGKTYRWYIVEKGLSNKKAKAVDIGNGLVLVLKEKTLRL